jgi:hypothetical protein
VPGRANVSPFAGVQRQIRNFQIRRRLGALGCGVGAAPPAEEALPGTAAAKKTAGLARLCHLRPKLLVVGIRLLWNSNAAAERLLMRIHCAQLATAFSAWQGLAAAMTVRQHALRRALVLMSNFVLMRAYVSWQNAAQVQANAEPYTC